MRRPLRLVLVVWLAGATGCSCGGPPSPADGGTDSGPEADGGVPGADAGWDLATHYVAGTRLAPRWLSTAAGARAFQGWWDGLRKERCNFVVAGDGELRCVPDVAALDRETTFADPACTEPAVSSTIDSCDSATVVRRRDVTTCPPRTRFFSLGAELASDGGVVSLYRRAAPGGPCTAQSSHEGRWFRLGPELPPSSFIKATVASVPLSTNLEGRFLEAEDGARSFRGLTDATAKLECDAAVGKDGVIRCLPRQAAYVSSGQFADSSCTQPVAAATHAACPAPSFATNLDFGTCPPVTIVFGVGAAVSSVWSPNGASCAPQSVGAGEAVYRLQSESPPSSFIPLPERDGGVSYGRLRARTLELPGGAMHRYGSWRDTQLGLDCYFDVAGDGARRCVPSFSLTFSVFFSDPACTQPLALGSSSTACPPSHVGSWDQNFCPPRTHVFPITGKFTGTVHRLQGTSCVQHTPGAGQVFYSAGPEVDPTSLVPVAASNP